MGPDAVSGLVGPGRGQRGARGPAPEAARASGTAPTPRSAGPAPGCSAPWCSACWSSIGSDSSSQALQHSGIGFVWSGTWNPAAGQYGAGILVVGTLLTTAVAMVLMVPIGLGTAVFLSELAPRWLVGTALDRSIGLLAAVPSIVVGLWGLLVLTPDLRQPGGAVPRLGARSSGGSSAGEAYGPSILLASVVLAVMTLPTMVALSRTAFGGVPRRRP